MARSASVEERSRGGTPNPEAHGNPDSKRDACATEQQDISSPNADGLDVPAADERDHLRPGRQPPGAGSASAAATVMAPLGSATTFASRNTMRMASTMARSSTVTTRSTKARMCGKVRSPGRTASRPSAMPGILEGHLTAGLHRRAHFRSAGGLDGHNLHGRVRPLDGGRDAADEAAAADRHVDRPDARALLEDLEADGPLPRP